MGILHKNHKPQKNHQNLNLLNIQLLTQSYHKCRGKTDFALSVREFNIEWYPFFGWGNIGPKTKALVSYIPPCVYIREIYETNALSPECKSKTSMYMYVRT